MNEDIVAKLISYHDRECKILNAAVNDILSSTANPYIELLSKKIEDLHSKTTSSLQSLNVKADTSTNSKGGRSVDTIIDRLDKLEERMSRIEVCYGYLCTTKHHLK